ncbi:MAG: type II 3-dehydroquinate dehydratase [Clostridia bacterium]|nr:type II 3-dehydroquinate dehydratase [Clostridia bacterium]
MKILVMNGVNLNLTGKREQSVYGRETLEEINARIAAYCKENGDDAEFFQSNYEGALVDKLHEAFLNRSADGIIFNAGAFTHYSYALRDAIAAIDLPVVEVHMSNVHAREEFRRTSVISEVCRGTVSGFGAGSYLAAITGLKAMLKK